MKYIPQNNWFFFIFIYRTFWERKETDRSGKLQNGYYGYNLYSGDDNLDIYIHKLVILLVKFTRKLSYKNIFGGKYYFFPVWNIF